MCLVLFQRIDDNKTVVTYLETLLPFMMLLSTLKIMNFVIEEINTLNIILEIFLFPDNAVFFWYYLIKTV